MKRVFPPQPATIEVTGAAPSTITDSDPATIEVTGAAPSTKTDSDPATIEVTGSLLTAD